MDTLSHAVGGFLITASFNAPIEVNIASAILGALPDVIGAVEKLVKKDSAQWNWYEKAHYKWKWLWLIPSYGLHILLDSFTHDEGKKWWKPKERLWAEMLYWIILVSWAFILI